MLDATLEKLTDLKYITILSLKTTVLPLGVFKNATSYVSVYDRSLFQYSDLFLIVSGDCFSGLDHVSRPENQAHLQRASRIIVLEPNSTCYNETDGGNANTLLYARVLSKLESPLKLWYVFKTPTNVQVIAGAYWNSDTEAKFYDIGISSLNSSLM